MDAVEENEGERDSAHGANGKRVALARLRSDRPEKKAYSRSRDRAEDPDEESEGHVAEILIAGQADHDKNPHSAIMIEEPGSRGEHGDERAESYATSGR